MLVMIERKMCTYCGKWHDFSVMTPLYEEGKTFVVWYCEGCLPIVKSNLYNLPFKALFTWGTRGQET